MVPKTWFPCGNKKYQHCEMLSSRHQTHGLGAGNIIDHLFEECHQMRGQGYNYIMRDISYFYRRMELEDKGTTIYFSGVGGVEYFLKYIISGRLRMK